MKTKKAKLPLQPQRTKNKRIKKKQAQKWKNNIVDLTISPGKIRMTRMAKRKQLAAAGASKNISNALSSSSSHTKKQPYDFAAELNDYRVLRNLDLPNQSVIEITSTPLTSPSAEAIVIDDSEVEEGEIVDDDEPVNNVNKLMEESKEAVQRSMDIRGSPSIGAMQLTFYEDKNLENMRASRTPVYDSTQTKDKSENGSQDVICLDSTFNASDDSVVLMSENQSPAKALRRPSCLTTQAINSLFKKVPKLKTPNRQQPNKKPRQRKIDRTKEYMKRKKQQILSKQVKNNNNQASTSASSVQQPSTSAAANTPNNLTSLNAPAPDFIPLSSLPFDFNALLLSSSPPPKSIPLQHMPPAVPRIPPPPTLASRSTAATQNEKKKRIILIDGSNVALMYESQNGKISNIDKDGRAFSAEGLKIAIDYFLEKGFQVKAIIPEFRVRRHKSSNFELMTQLKHAGLLIETPSKSYDDLMLLQSAAELDAAIVSNDFFRDIRNQHKEHEPVLDTRQIRYNWVFGKFILTVDPYGRSGPKLNDILYH